MPKRQSTTQFARHRRLNQTTSEYVLWQSLRNRQLAGYKFRRQHPVPPYTLDFYCEATKLAVELDGSGHQTDFGITYDKARDDFLAKLGIRVLRFPSEQIEANVVDILERIREELEQCFDLDFHHDKKRPKCETKSPHPRPFSQGEKGE
jgi:very-short-patch-repair endonuclease